MFIGKYKPNLFHIGQVNYIKTKNPVTDLVKTNAGNK